jgi:hypothetical protein
MGIIKRASRSEFQGVGRISRYLRFSVSNCSPCPIPMVSGFVPCTTLARDLTCALRGMSKRPDQLTVARSEG